MRLSVVIPTYNRAHLIQRALESALRDCGPEDEILVVDDGSSDDTERVVKEFEDKRLRYIWQENAGAGVARNRGTQEATRELVAYLDSDDEWLPGKTALQRRFMASRPEVLFSFTNFAREYGGQRHGCDIRAWHTDPRSWEEIMGTPISYSSVAPLPPGITDFLVYIGNIYHGEMHTNYLSTCCLMVRRIEAGAALHFAEDMKTFEDWECFGRLARSGLAAYLDFEAAVNYAHPGPRLTDASLLVCAESRLKVLRNVWGCDAEFIREHGDEYLALVSQQQLAKVRGLLVSGRPQEGRNEIARLKCAPFSYRVLSRLPGGLVRYLLELRRKVFAYRAPIAKVKKEGRA